MDDEIVRLRKCGFVRLTIINHYGETIEALLPRFGLHTTDPLLRLSRSRAIDTLRAILWKDLAYGCELMARQDADRLAEALVRQFSEESSTFHSNGDWASYREASHFSWSPMTQATLDAGLLVRTPHTAVCYWVEDED